MTPKSIGQILYEADGGESWCSLPEAMQRYHERRASAVARAGGGGVRAGV